MGPPRAITAELRERELYRLYDPLPLIHSSSRDATPGVPKSSQDTSLTAFAQLGALRLNVRRAVITLFDRKHQYLVAEATQTLSLQSDDTHKLNDQLIWGHAVIAHDATPCQNAFRLPDVPRDSHNDLASNLTPTSCVIPDLTLDDTFKDRNFVKDYPGTRFFLGVPMRSPRGINIGAYCVLDDSPHNVVDEVHIKFMHDIAKTIVSHLEAVKYKVESHRSERMLRGLNSFVDGESTMRTAETSEPQRPSEGINSEGRLDKRQQLARERIKDSDLWSAQQQYENENNENEDLSPEETKYLLRSRMTERADPSITAALNAESAKASRPLGDRSSGFQGDELAKNIEQIFSRAANIIREALSVEGAVFFDSSVKSFGGLIRTGRDRYSDEESPNSDRHHSPSSSGEDRLPTSPGEEDKDGLCKILGFSTSDISSINYEKPQLDYLTLEQSTLARILRHCPHGKIFEFNEHGVAIDGYSSEDSSSGREMTSDTSAPAKDINTRGTSRAENRKLRRQMDSASLVKLFPGARSIAVMPLQGSDQRRSFAGVMVWTASSMRVMTPLIELSYLSAFGSSILSETVKADVRFADETKRNLLSSVSHELRSPLHGILGSAELLGEYSREQNAAVPSDLIYSIETCGRTLLDTINHLLDFAKINDFTKRAKTSRYADRRFRKNSSGFESRARFQGRPVLTSEVDLAKIVEEVCEAVFVGHNPSMSTDGAIDEFQSTVNTQLENKSAKTGRRPIVLIDVVQFRRLVYVTQPGAWRRILMNLFGNALKYTDRGCVMVKLSAEKSSSGKSKDKVILQVRDSGKGMSKSYLETGLFTPFTQESSLSPGTGLGLSIVQNIVLALGGRIDVQSAQGSGTSVTVTVPLKGLRGAEHFGSEDPRFKNLVVSLHGFDGPGFDGRSERLRDEDSDNRTATPAFATFHATLAKTCADVLGMNVVSTTTPTVPSDANFYILSEASYTAISNESRNGNAPNTMIDSKRMDLGPAVVICDNKTSAITLTSRVASRHARTVQFISHPCGPNKLSNAIGSVLDQMAILESQPNMEVGVRPKTPTKKAGDTSTTEPPLSANPIQQNSIASTPPNGRKRRILIVDDNNVNLQLLKGFVKKAKYDFETASNGLEAVETFKSAEPKFSIVLMDLSMPVMDGFEATRQIRGFEREKTIKASTIIALTGLASGSAQDEAYASGVDVFMTKPVKFQGLMEMLDAV